MHTTNNPFMALQQKPQASSIDAPQNSAVPLASYRLAVKDLFHIAGMPTAAGNPDWLATHEIPTVTSPVVTALLENGARFVGKTITDELAYSLNGQNKHYGMPVNPVTPDRIPGGSSSGSAVAVSMQLADIGLGTDTGGSIRVPASYQGLFGLRPTHGAICTDNMVALAPSFDTVGVLTKRLKTLSDTMDVLLPAQTDDNILPVVKVDNLIAMAAHGEQIHQWWEQNQPLYPELLRGSCSLDLTNWPTGEMFRILQGSEIWKQHGDWLTLTKPDIADDIQLRLNSCEALTDDEVATAQSQRTAFTKWFTGLVQEQILLLPTTPGLAPLIDADAAALADYRSKLLALTSLAGLSGCPQLHVPALTLDGAPCGFSLLGPKGSDKTLLRLAHTLYGNKK